MIDQNEQTLYTSLSTDLEQASWSGLKEGKNSILTKIPTSILVPGKYTISIHISLHHQKWICNAVEKQLMLNFEVVKNDIISPYWDENTIGLINVQNQFISR